MTTAPIPTTMDDMYICQCWPFLSSITFQAPSTFSRNYIYIREDDCLSLSLSMLASMHSHSLHVQISNCVYDLTGQVIEELPIQCIVGLY